MPRTAAAFFDFLDRHARHCPRLFLLGDIFEYWAGDDDLGPFNLQVIEAVRRVADGGTQVHWIAGNRDFLAGEAFAKAAGLDLLPDPYLLRGAGPDIVLTHGDALCTDDTGYMQFRAMVRQPQWQREFLSQPLEKRKAIIAGVRQGSKDAQRGKADYIMDVNGDAVRALFAATGTRTMIHGHTHRPALHESEGYRRYVLPDWDCDGDSPRGGWIALYADGTIVRVGLDGQSIV